MSSGRQPGDRSRMSSVGGKAASGFGLQQDPSIRVISGSAGQQLAGIPTRYELTATDVTAQCGFQIEDCFPELHRHDRPGPCSFWPR